MKNSLAKCCIINLDEPGTKINAQYNPNKVNVGKSVLWHSHPSSDGTADMLEFGNAKNRTLSVELFFDGMEGDTSKRSQGSQSLSATQPMNVEKKYVLPLIAMTEPDKKRPTGKGGERTWRPPMVMIAWGRMQPFRGVIESLSYDFTMFMPNGAPVRATVNLQVKEVDLLQIIKPGKAPN